MKVIFKQTCSGCPEQYDVFNGTGEQIGYVRLRYGSLRAECPGYGGRVVYSADVSGDGCFRDNAERSRHLALIADAIREFHEPSFEVLMMDDFDDEGDDA